ncbi:uncharacterized protein V1516DRAFT_680011 [Lipomyces oligophaga]|uniref:uncharacterized protein n=1 Tax=Lipomyces oligophaga TaxID=45792 RepID=UPI0034CF912D
MSSIKMSSNKRKISKNQQKRARLKQRKLETQSETVPDKKSIVETHDKNDLYNEDEEYRRQEESNLDEGLHVDVDDPAFAAYKSVIEHFQTADDEDENYYDEYDKADIYYSDDDNIQDEEEEAATLQHVMSKKKLRKLNKISIAQLKATAPRPDVVEWVDSDATDPLFLVRIKGSKNVVPVPAHWSFKREYLSSKRGIEKPPFELPDFIKYTGIMDMRDNTKEDESTLKQRTRERVQPKMGRLDIDYQKLHDAFFKFQTKPKLTGFGEVYYEGKEFESDATDRRPGVLSDELQQALEMPPGAPPPWLLNMQRFGPPPSYPGLRVPGLNAPIPSGAQWGFQPGGWGKPPVDETTNRPLYGDVFGVLEAAQDTNGQENENVDRTYWGELLTEEEEEDDDEEEEDEEGRAEGIDEAQEEE